MEQITPKLGDLNSRTVVISSFLWLPVAPGLSKGCEVSARATVASGGSSTSKFTHMVAGRAHVLPGCGIESLSFSWLSASCAPPQPRLRALPPGPLHRAAQHMALASLRVSEEEGCLRWLPQPFCRLTLRIDILLLLPYSIHLKITRSI